MALGKSLGNILDNYFGTDNDSLPDHQNANNNLLQNNSQQKIDSSNSKSNLAIKDTKLVLKPKQSLPYAQIDIDNIEISNPYQTREYFDDKKIKQLASDIKLQGLIQPIVIIEKSDYEKSGKYILLAGERRLRACISLGYKTIACVIRQSESLNSKQQSILTVMENLQREDLSSLEMSKTILMLMQTHNIDEAEVAKLLDKSKQYVDNHLRLLKLCDHVQSMLLHKNLSETQARYLLPLDEKNQIFVASEILNKELTVKQIANLVQKIMFQKIKPKNIAVENKVQAIPQELQKYVAALETKISGAKSVYQGNAKKGRIVISW